MVVWIFILDLTNHYHNERSYFRTLYFLFLTPLQGLPVFNRFLSFPGRVPRAIATAPLGLFQKTVTSKQLLKTTDWKIKKRRTAPEGSGQVVRLNVPPAFRKHPLSTRTNPPINQLTN